MKIFLSFWHVGWAYNYETSQNRGPEYGMAAICNGHYRIRWGHKAADQAVKFAYEASILPNRKKEE